MNTVISKLNKDPFNYSKDLEIDELEKIISYAADKFFNEKSIISDEIYDLLIDFLRYKDPKNKLLKKVGAEVKSKNKVKLDYYLGSMDKIKPPSNHLEKWLKRYHYPFVLSEKLDGVSALLIYKKNGDIKLYTRGTASHGTDISSIVKYLNLPSFEIVNDYVKKNKLSAKLKDNLIAFRGELILSKKIFEKHFSSTKSNARNTISGLVNSKKIDPILAGLTDLVIYEVADPFPKLLNQFKIIKEIGLKLVHFKEMKEIDFDILSEYLKKRKEKSTYVIDGIIVSNNVEHKRNEKDNPDYAFAFKDILEDQMAKSKIIDVEWKVSKDGIINPIVIIEPVKIGGVTISRITAYNAKYVVDNKLGKGAIIELIRSGDVIPKIVKVLKEAKKPDLPSGDWSWNDTKVDIVTNEKSSDMDIKNIYYFFATLDTKGMGEKIVEKLYQAGFTTILSILKASADDFLKLDGFKEKSAKNLKNSIKLAMTNNDDGIELSTLMKASNKLGHGMGRERAKLVLQNIPNLMTNYSKWSQQELIDKIKDIPGWEEKTSTQFVKNFQKFIDFYNSIKNYVKIKKVSSKKKKSELNDKIVVLSGFRDKDISTKLEELGVEVKNSISKNTYLLVVKDIETIEENTGKVKKAIDLGIKIITKDELVKLI